MDTDITFLGGTEKQKAFARALVRRGVVYLAGKKPGVVAGNGRPFGFLKAWIDAECCQGGNYSAEKLLSVLRAQFKTWHAAKVIDWLRSNTEKSLEHVLRFSWAEARERDIAAGVNVESLDVGEFAEWKGVQFGKEVELRASVNMEPCAVNSLQFKKALVFTLEKKSDEGWRVKSKTFVGCGAGKVTRSTYDAICARRAGELMAEFRETGESMLYCDMLLKSHVYTSRASIDRDAQEEVERMEAALEAMRNRD